MATFMKPIDASKAEGNNVSFAAILNIMAVLNRIGYAWIDHEPFRKSLFEKLQIFFSMRGHVSPEAKKNMKAFIVHLLDSQISWERLPQPIQAALEREMKNFEARKTKEN